MCINFKYFELNVKNLEFIKIIRINFGYGILHVIFVITASK